MTRQHPTLTQRNDRLQRPDRHTDITSHVSTYIKSRRKSLGLSTEALADLIDCSRTRVWRLETGRSKNPSLWMLLALCDGLQCSLNDLLGRDISQPIFTAQEMALVDAHRRIFASANGKT